MDRFEGGVAVVTGGASGIGLSLCRAFAREGMRIVLADIQLGRANEAVRALQAEGHQAVATACDVSQLAQVEALARLAVDTFGTVDILCNNAGVSAGGRQWEVSSDDWGWVLDVDLWGVIHGVRTFVPLMLAKGGPAHVINTASYNGLISGAGHGMYSAAKHAVVALSEALWLELKLAGAGIGVSVLCPGAVATDIVTSFRNRPGLSEAHKAAMTEATAPVRELIAGGMSPDAVAAQVLQAVREDRFWILTHPETGKILRRRLEWMLGEGPSPWDGMIARARAAETVS